MSFLRRPRLWITVVALIGAYAAAGFWLVPRGLSSGLRDAVATRYGRTLQLGSIRFNPFTFELEARSLLLPDADGGALLAFDRLYVNLSASSLVRYGLAFQAIELDGPHVRVVRRPDGKLNLQDLAGAPAAEPEPDSPPPRIWIERLAVGAGKVEVADETRSTPLRLALTPVDFTVRDFSSRSEGNAYVLSGESSLGEQLAWRGTFGLAPLVSRGDFQLAHVRAQTLAELALPGDQAPFEVRSGELALRGHYDVSQHGGELAARVDVSQLELSALALRTRGAQHDALLLPRLTVTDTRVDAGAQTVAIGRVELSEPQVRAVRERDGQLDLQRWQPRAAEPTPAPASAGAPWQIALPEIQLHRGDIQLTDRGASQPVHLHLSALELSVLGFASPARGPLELQLASGVNEAGQIGARGELTTSPLTAQLELDALGLPLAAIQPYLDDHTGVVLRDGRARLQGNLKLAADGGVAFQGQAGVDALHTLDAALQEDFIKWQRLDLLGLRAQSEPLSIAIDELVASEPYARVIVGPDHSLNLQEVLRPRATGSTPPSAAAPSPPQAASALPVTIARVRVENGSLNFKDLSLRPNFATGVQQLSGSITGLSGDPEARADVKLEGRVGRYSPAKITGKVNYFAAAKHTDLHLLFKNMELTAFSPYSGKFAGYKIERGKLNLDLHYLIDRRRLDATHKIVLDQLQLGAAVESPDATSLPVKLAVALLKDKNGVIDLDLPVSGNLDDPQFKIGPLIWKVVLNLLSRAVSAPFALLGSLFGGGDEISYIDFAPGQGALPQREREKLQTLARALEERPALSLDVPLLLAPQLDREALIAARWQQKRDARAVRELGSKAKTPGALGKLLATPAEYRALLERMYRESFGRAATIPPPPVAAQVAAPKPAPPRHTLLLDGPGHGALARRAQPRAAPPPPVLPRAAAPVQGLGHVVAPSGKAPPRIPDAYAITWLETQLKSRIPVPEQELSALAQARADSVQSALLDGTGVDPSRVFVIAAPPLERGTALRMQLALH